MIAEGKKSIIVHEIPDVPSDCVMGNLFSNLLVSVPFLEARLQQPIVAFAR